ncbi:MAG: T9SS type A sorting domain-containing protein [Bacteroidia bacterium]|nr:T9SS type A sorting domain-containing protein [Bacteroidia bacterium]
MKKHLLAICSIILLIIKGTSQNISSVTDGDWTNPSIWSCNCIPSNGNNITINNNILLSANYSYSSGSITITSSGILTDGNTGKKLTVAGGTLNNNGTIDVNRIITQSGSVNNYGTIKAEFYQNSINFFNTGIFTHLDTLINNALITNNGQFINIGVLCNGGIFTNNMNVTTQLLNNNGYFNNNKQLKTDLLSNTGTFTNRDSTISNNSIINQGYLNNESEGNIEVNTILLNKGSISNNAKIKNEGQIKVRENITNYDTLGGDAGYYEINDTTINYGHLTGSFTLCDLTPPNTAPYIDQNSGTIENSINWCIMTNSTSFKDQRLPYTVSPNPTNGKITLNHDANPYTVIKIYNTNGAMIEQKQNSSEIDLGNQNDGLYLFVIEINHKQVQIIKVILNKKAS